MDHRPADNQIRGKRKRSKWQEKKTLTFGKKSRKGGYGKTPKKKKVSEAVQRNSPRRGPEKNKPGDVKKNRGWAKNAE